MFFHKQLSPSVKSNELKAEKLKAKIIAAPRKLERDADRLNKLLLADGITLKILYATGGDRRGHD